MTHWQAYAVLLALSGSSLFSLVQCYRKGRLLTPAGGIHLQILLFFGLGGVVFVLLPDAEPILSRDEILELTGRSCLPLLLGYVIALVVERHYWRWPAQREMILTRAGVFKPGILLLVAFFGFAGCLLEGRVRVAAVAAIPTYFKNLFFPCFLLALINGPVRLDTAGRLIRAVIVLFALIVGVWSPWRSILIILGATVLLAVVMRKPKWLPVVLLGGAFALSLLIPFQNLKKNDFESFRADPMSTVRAALAMGMAERSEEVGEFLAKRVNYVREQAYVQRALDAGMELQHGKTYTGILYQLVPRMFWKGKPELASWAGYELPRQAGLLSEADESTSWAVNMFSEVTYNFGPSGLLWFVPLVFLLANSVEKLMGKFCTTPQAVLLGNLSFLYLMLGQTTVIFAASISVALLLVVKVFEVLSTWSGMELPGSGPGPRRGSRGLGNRGAASQGRK